MDKWNQVDYIASLPDMPLDELCERLRSKYPNGVIYGASPLMAEAARRLERMHQDRLILDRKIHNQRTALRETWEIVEMRRKWLGSDTARRMYCNLLKRYRQAIGRDPMTVVVVHKDGANVQENR